MSIVELDDRYGYEMNDNGGILVDLRTEEDIRIDREIERLRIRKLALTKMEEDRPVNWEPKVVSADKGSALFPAKYNGWCGDCYGPYLVGDSIGYVKTHPGPLCEDCHGQNNDYIPNFDYSW